MIRREVAEQTVEIRKSLDELKSFQGCHNDEMRQEEAITQGPKIRGSRGELEPRVKKIVKEPVKMANSGGRAIKTKQNLRGVSEIALIKAQLRYWKQALINIRQANLRHREEEGRE